MKALIYAILLAHVIMSVVVAGMQAYSDYLKRQIDEMIEELSKEEEDNDTAD